MVNLRRTGVRTFSKVAELGKDFIHHLCNGERYVDCVTASDNYSHPLFKRCEAHPVWNIDLQDEPSKTIGQDSHLYA
jgi:hypothetical protein